MSLGNHTDSGAAAQDEDDWASRDDSAAVLTAADAQDVVAPPASSNGQVEASSGDQTDTRAADLAILGDACPICLQTLEDPVMLTGCYHVYCFECLSTWVHSMALHGVEPATCPLCKASFLDVYTNLVRVAEAEVADSDVFPKMLKVKGEYKTWLERELQACIGRDIDLTVLLSIIQCCVNKIAQCGAKKCYEELQQALEPFLYEDAVHFVRELAYFLGSRLNLQAYDAAVKYRCENAADFVLFLRMGQ
ncbi:hypothetical protein BBP00_00003791 [Phytophthora kernoviae]|uniref:RING-type domain-containing protein n=1 Tax=Phytophthora kernoviae TaxID=325452 RepID=A0A3F2RV35_9STRA|nr:hypothetical protein BBP00_00003791 [Phytophthora kernoviae]